MNSTLDYCYLKFNELTSSLSLDRSTRSKQVAQSISKIRGLLFATANLCEQLIVDLVIKEVLIELKKLRSILSRFQARMSRTLSILFEFISALKKEYLTSDLCPTYSFQQGAL